jgi:hypothetical protein
MADGAVGGTSDVAKEIAGGRATPIDSATCDSHEQLMYPDCGRRRDELLDPAAIAARRRSMRKSNNRQAVTKRPKMNFATWQGTRKCDRRVGRKSPRAIIEQSIQMLNSTAQNRGTENGVH